MSSVSGLGPMLDLTIFIGLCLAAQCAVTLYFTYR